jgi:hypothetical protein
MQRIVQQTAFAAQASQRRRRFSGGKQPHTLSSYANHCLLSMWHCHNVTHATQSPASHSLTHGSFPQIFALSIAAMVSAIVYLLDYRLLRWRLSGKDIEGDRIWENLRRFSGCMCAGSLFGVFSFFAWMQALNDEYDSNVITNRRRFYELQASLYSYIATVNFFYPLNLLCDVYAINMLLRRVSDHASHSYYNVARDHVDRSASRPKTSVRLERRDSTIKRDDWRDCIGQYALYNWVRFMNRIATAICLTNIVVRFILVGFRAQVAGLFREAAAATDVQGGETRASLDVFGQAFNNLRARDANTLAVSRALEASVLVLLASAFLLFFPTCIIMFRRVERRLDTILYEMDLRSDIGNVFLPFEFSPDPPEPDGTRNQIEMPIVEARKFLRNMKSAASAQRRRFLVCLVLALTCLVALASLATFTTFFASNEDTTGSNNDCGRCDPSCQDVRNLIVVWYRYTPEFYTLIESLCSVLPLIFGLWLMTTKEDRAMLLNPRNFRPEAVLVQLQTMSTESSHEARIKSEARRMGIYLT